MAAYSPVAGFIINVSLDGNFCAKRFMSIEDAID